MGNIINTIKLLRLPFSLFLLPISLFSFFYIHPEINTTLFLVLLIWHLLVFPSSNGYNSYNDRDEGPIGGLAAPPKPTKLLLYVSNGLDILAILLSLAVNINYSLFVAGYIIFSRLYSYKSIRLKKLPITGFLVVFLFQGIWVFIANIYAFNLSALLFNPAVRYAAIACSFFIAVIYPLTQIYQHESDIADGVKTLSIVLGIKGTFIFSALMFMLATFFIFLSFDYNNTIGNFWLFNIVMLPSTLYFITWAAKSFKDNSHSNFKNTMRMLILSSLLNNFFFIILLLK